jgi:hypothetical protein
MKNFKEFLNVIDESKYSDREIKGFIDNAVETPKIVYVNADVSQMSAKKSGDVNIPVTVVKLTTSKIKPLNLNHVRTAKDEDGVFVRKIKGNPIAAVFFNKKNTGL